MANPPRSDADCTLLERATFAAGSRVEDLQLASLVVPASTPLLYVVQPGLFESRLFCWGTPFFCLDHRVALSTSSGSFTATLAATSP